MFGVVLGPIVPPTRAVWTHGGWPRLFSFLPWFPKCGNYQWWGRRTLKETWAKWHRGWNLEPKWWWWTNQDSSWNLADSFFKWMWTVWAEALVSKCWSFSMNLLTHFIDYLENKIFCVADVNKWYVRKRKHVTWK